MKTPQFKAGKRAKVDLNDFFTRDTSNAEFITVGGKSDERLQIFAGDWVLIDKDKKPSVGDICVYKTDDIYNFDYYVEGDEAEFEVYGVVIFHVRKASAISYGILDAEVIL